MKRCHKFVCTLCSAVIAFATQACSISVNSFETWPCEMPSPSKKSSISHKSFLESLQCVPTSFEWQGQNIQVTDVWIERGKRDKLAIVCLRLDRIPPRPFGLTCKDTIFLSKQNPYFWAFRNWLGKFYVYTLYIPDDGLSELSKCGSMKIEANEGPPACLREGAPKVDLNLQVE